jgi:hypothetical protein
VKPRNANKAARRSVTLSLDSNSTAFVQGTGLVTDALDSSKMILMSQQATKRLSTAGPSAPLLAVLRKADCPFLEPLVILEELWPDDYQKGMKLFEGAAERANQR